MQRNIVARSAARAAQWVRNTVAFNRELRDLQKLSDRELRDMGMTRYDVSKLSRNLSEHTIGR